MRATAGKRASRWRDLAGIGSLRGAHNAQNAACAAARPASALGLDAGGDPAGLASLSRPCAPHGAGRAQRATCCSSTIPKATNADSAAQALASFHDIFWIAGGKPKTGGIDSLAEFFPRIRKAYLIGEAAEDFAKTLDGKVAYEIAGTLDRAVAARRARCGSSGAEGAGGAAVAGLRLVRPVPQFRGARRGVPRSGAGDAGDDIPASFESVTLILARTREPCPASMTGARCHAARRPFTPID